MRIWLGDGDGGRLVDPREARVSAVDHGFTVADGVFETLKITPEGPFALSRHLRRLASSAALLGLPDPDATVMRDAVALVSAAWCADGGQFGRLRITYTSGAAPLGSERGHGTPTMVVAATDASPWPATTSVTVTAWTRNERSSVAGAKTTSYAENVVALQHAHAAGFSEALFANTLGDICEGTGTNVFVVRDGQILTPSLSSGCLPGITRELVLEWFDVLEADMPLDALAEADEIFLTSSTRDVHPVTRLDERSWPEAGPISAQLQRAFAERASQDVDP